MSATEIDDVPLFENPDPRGPCGAAVPQPPLNGAIGRSFSANALEIVEVVTPAGPSQEEYLAALRADVRPGCAPFQSTTNTGATQRVSEITFINLDDLAVEGLAWTSTISSGGQAAKAAAFAFRANGRFRFVQLQSSELPAPDRVQELAQRALERLNN